jgi:hypothetical protein
MCVPSLFTRKGDGGDVVDLVMAASDAGLAVSIEDTFVFLLLVRPVEDAPSLAWAVDIGIRIADRLAAARTNVPPPPWEPPFAATLQALAQARALRFDPARLAVTGSAAEVTMEVSLTTTAWAGDPAYAIDVAGLYPPLGVLLSVFPAKGVTGIARAFMRAAKTGDAAFDDAFWVNADKGAPVASWFGPEVRARMRSMLAQAISVNVDDDRAVLRIPPTVQDPAALAYAYDDVAAVACGVSRAVRGAPPGPGPYR